MQAEEIKANEKAQKAQAIADDAQKDLDEALPALDAALASLRNLNKNDVTEVGGQTSPRPSPGISSWCPLGPLCGEVMVELELEPSYLPLYQPQGPGRALGLEK